MSESDPHSPYVFNCPLAAICLCVVLKFLSASCLCASGVQQQSRRLLLRYCCRSLPATVQREVQSESAQPTADWLTAPFCLHKAHRPSNSTPWWSVEQRGLYLQSAAFLEGQVSCQIWSVAFARLPRSCVGLEQLSRHQTICCRVVSRDTVLPLLGEPGSTGCRQTATRVTSKWQLQLLSESLS